jgi:DtxR family Mn-dependent transcriptional regulator
MTQPGDASLTTTSGPDPAAAAGDIPLADAAEWSAAVQDYLKVIWSQGEWGDPATTAKDLSTRLGLPMARVSETIKRLTAEGLVDHQPYKPITLTARGQQIALAMVRRHRLIEAFLVNSLGYGWDEVHDEAENLEHSVSDLLIDRVDALLGHPEFDPHGDPIPSKDGRVRHPSEAIRLTDADPGDYRIVRISDADPDRLVYFGQRRLLPDETLRVVAQDRDAGTVIVRADNETETALGPASSGAVMIAPLDSASKT